TGAGFSPKISLPSIGYHGDSGLHFADLNQDGYPDLIGSTTNGWEFKVHHWDTGTSKFSSIEKLISVSTPMSYQEQVRFQDINSDGAIDYFSAVKNRNPSLPNQTAQLHQKSYNGTNKVSVITDGLGKAININYEPLSSSQHYSYIKGVNPSGASESICQDTDI